MWVQPSWWIEFVEYANQFILNTVSFLQNLSAYGILFFVLGIWLLIMGLWIRQFSARIGRLYWVGVVIYFLVGIWMLY